MGVLEFQGGREPLPGTSIGEGSLEEAASEMNFKLGRVKLVEEDTAGKRAGIV